MVVLAKGEIVLTTSSVLLVTLYPVCYQVRENLVFGTWLNHLCFGRRDQCHFNQMHINVSHSIQFVTQGPYCHLFTL